MKNSIRIAAAVLLFTTSMSMSARDRSNARSMVITPDGIVATSHVQASVAGAKILARGGSAVDAAIAANAVLGVTEPMMNGMGGDLFAIYWDAKTGKLYGLNASGWAPRGLTIAHMKAKDATAMPWKELIRSPCRVRLLVGMRCTTVSDSCPGKIFSSRRFFMPTNGYPVPEVIASYWKDAAETVCTRSPRRGGFICPVASLRAWEQVFQNPDLAKALRLVADGGADAFYKGEIARAIVSTSQSLGGTMSADDLAEFSPEWVEPISTTYRDWTVYELPPNGQGMAALEMLNIMETSPPSPDGPLSVGGIA